MHPTSGSATIGGVAYRSLDDPTGAVGAALEATAFHPGRSGRNHLRWICASAGLPVARVDDVLAAVELSDAARRRVGGYSLGMKQRLALAAALLGDPGVLVLDEPANGLDPEGIRWLRDFLRARAEEGRTVLISSHVLSEIEQIAHTVVIIDKGRLVRQARLSELQSGADLVVTVRSPQIDALARAIETAGGRVDRGADTLSVRGMAQERIGDLAATAGIALHELRGERATLESTFLDLTAGGPKEGE